MDFHHELSNACPLQENNFVNTKFLSSELDIKSERIQVSPH